MDSVQSFPAYEEKRPPYPPDLYRDFNPTSPEFIPSPFPGTPQELTIPSSPMDNHLPSNVKYEKQRQN